MANQTVKDAKSIHGTNPQYLVKKIIRSRIYNSKYWKEECFALTAELLVDKAMALRYVGGVHGGFIYPTPFLCLVLKMLQIQPEKDIVVEFIKNEEFKYVRALGAFYMRLTGSSLDCYKYLEPLYNDSKKLRRQNREGQFEIVHMDEFIDELLREERLCDVILPRIQKRYILERNNELEHKVSELKDNLDEDMASDEENVDTETKENKKEKNKRDRDRKRDRPRDRDRRDKDGKRERSRSRERERRRERERGAREKERERRRERERGAREKERERERDRERIREREREREKERRERHEVERRRDRGRYYFKY